MMTLNAGSGETNYCTVRLDLRKTNGINMRGDVQNLPFKDNAFDITICVEVIEHIPDWRRTIGELCRVTKKRIVIDVPVNSNTRFTDAFRFLLPTPRNIRLLIRLKKNAGDHIWQFTPDNIATELSEHGFISYSQKYAHFKGAYISRCWRISGLK